MTKTIALLQGKGGTAKTTTAINLAGAFLEMGFDVQIADMDPQQSALAWPRNGSVLTGRIHPMSADNAKSAYNEIADDADILIIDTPPSLSSREPMLAAHLADVVIIPCLAGAQEYHRAKKTLDSIEVFDKPFWFLPSVLDYREAISHDAAATLEQLGPVLQPSIRRAVAMRESGFTGQWIGEYAPNSICHHQFRILSRKLCEILTIDRMEVADVQA